MKKEKVCAIVSGYFGIDGLDACIENLLPVVDEILIIDAEGIPSHCLSNAQVKDYSRKSLNDAVTLYAAQHESEKSDWLFLQYANETFDWQAALNTPALNKIPAKVEGIQFPVATTGAGGKIEFCQFETRLVRVSADLKVEALNQLSVNGKTNRQRIPVYRNLQAVSTAHFSKVHLRIRDDAVRYWERCPGDLQAVFSFFQYLHWAGDYDEIAGNCLNTLANFSEQLRQQSEYWGIFAIGATACFQVKETDAFDQNLKKAREILPENHLDLLYINCLDAKLNNDQGAIISAAEKYLSRHKTVKKNPVQLAKNSIYALGFEKHVSLWKLVCQTALEHWQPAYKGLRQLTKLPDFTTEDALEMLEEMQFISSDKLGDILPILWQSFSSPQFVFDSLKIFPFDILNEKTRSIITKKLLPQFRQKKNFAAGLLFMQLGYFQDALDIFLQFINDIGHAEKAMFNAAQMYLELGFFEDAIQILSSLLRQFPSNKDARLLYEGLNPDVGVVQPADSEGENEIEQTLLEAVEAINHYVQKQKFEPVLSLVKQVHDVLAPYSEIKVEIFSDLAPALTRIESLAISHCYLQLADEIHQMKSALKASDTESKIEPK